MSKLLPYIDKGMLLGVGAAFNYFSGEIKDIPNWTKKFHVVWVYRLLTEPKKQLKRLMQSSAVSSIISLRKLKNYKNTRRNIKLKN